MRSIFVPRHTTTSPPPGITGLANSHYSSFCAWRCIRPKVLVACEVLALQTPQVEQSMYVCVPPDATELMLHMAAVSLSTAADFVLQHFNSGPGIFQRTMPRGSVVLDEIAEVVLNTEISERPRLRTHRSRRARRYGGPFGWGNNYTVSS